MTIYPTVKVYLDLSGAPLTDWYYGRTWTDVTEWVCHEPLTISKGRPRHSDDFLPTTGSFSLISEAGAFDPSDETGTYYPNFGMRTPIKIEASDEWRVAEDPMYTPETFTLGEGYITSINVRWNYRNEQVADVTWTDLMGMLASVELPDSAWDYVISQRSGVVAWHKLGSDSTHVARDYSGNENHGRYKIYEGSTTFYGAADAPDIVVRDGQSEVLMPEIGRPSQSWGKMIASAGQPLGGVTSGRNWRATSVVCAQQTALVAPGAEWAVEAWVTLRQAYAITAGETPSTSTIINSLFQWGETADWAGNTVPGPNGPLLRIGFFQSLLSPQWYNTAAFTATAWVATSFSTTVTDVRQPLYVSASCNGSQLTVYVGDPSVLGSMSGTTVTPAQFPRGFPLVVGPSSGFGISHPAGYHRHAWWGSVGDVVVYDRALTLTENFTSLRSGVLGRITNNGDPLEAWEALDQASDIAANDVYSVVAGSTSTHSVRPGPFERRSALDYMRLVARSDGGALLPYGAILAYRDANWVTRNDATTVSYILVDDDTVDPMTGWLGDGNIVLGHTGGTLSLDDAGIANDVTVRWVGGEVRAENTTSIARWGRFRYSIDTVLSDERQARARAQFEAWRRGSPEPYIGDITVEPTSATEFDAVLDLWLLNRWRVVLTRPDGSKWDNDVWIERIAHTIDMGQGTWRTTLGVTRADWPAAPFLIGTSELNGGDAVWY